MDKPETLDCRIMVRLRPSDVRVLDEWSREDRRTRSQLLRVIIEDAIARRRAEETVEQ